MTNEPEARMGEVRVPPGAKHSQCRSCKAEIVWTMGARGGSVPLSAATIQTRGGQWYALPHFADCPQASGWSRQAGRKLRQQPAQQPALEEGPDAVAGPVVDERSDMGQQLARYRARRAELGAYAMAFWLSYQRPVGLSADVETVDLKADAARHAAQWGNHDEEA